jgi:hypothetical protein
MSEENEPQLEFRAETVPYQPVPKPIQPKQIYQKNEDESSPYQELHDIHPKHTAHRHMLKTLHKSMITSERMIQVFLSVSSVQQRTRQIQLLHECSDACATGIRYMSRNSPFSGKMVKMCARICEAYHRECSHYFDPESQMVLETLRKCAQECRNFAIMY